MDVTLDGIAAWDGTHLSEAAQLWSQHADLVSTTTSQHSTEAASASGDWWTGLGSDALSAKAAVTHGMSTVGTTQLTQAAQIAGQAASTLTDLQGEVAHMATNARNAGFDVAQDGSVDVPSGTQLPAAEMAEKETEAKGFEAQLKSRMATFASTEMTTAGQLGGAVQAVDFKTNGPNFGTDPVNGNPIGSPPSGSVPDGKQWWYHIGEGWKLDDHLIPCDSNSVEGDLLSIAGGIGAVMAPITGPFALLPVLNAMRAIGHIDQCEGP